MSHRLLEHVEKLFLLLADIPVAPASDKVVCSDCAVYFFNYFSRDEGIWIDLAEIVYQAVVFPPFPAFLPWQPFIYPGGRQVIDIYRILPLYDELHIAVIVLHGRLLETFCSPCTEADA